jgi:hypothetical protein
MSYLLNLFLIQLLVAISGFSNGSNVCLSDVKLVKLDAPNIKLFKAWVPIESFELVIVPLKVIWVGIIVIFSDAFFDDGFQLVVSLLFHTLSSVILHLFVGFGLGRCLQSFNRYLMLLFFILSLVFSLFNFVQHLPKEGLRIFPFKLALS